MAIITYKELVKVIMDHPDYLAKWDMGAPANQYLTIQFSGDEEAANANVGNDYKTHDRIGMNTNVGEEDGYLYSIDFY